MNSRTRLFRYLWRFNAVIIALAGVLAVFVLLVSIYFIIKEGTRTRNVTAIVHTTGAADVDEKWVFGHFREIEGSSVVVIPLEAEQTYSVEYSGKAANSVRNLLFLDTRAGSQKWLLKENNNLILKYTPVTPASESPSEKKAVGMFYRIVEADTNDDGRLNRSDLFSLAISDTSGERFTVIFANVASLFGEKVLENGDLFVLFEKDGQAQSATVDMSAGKVRDVRSIATLQSAP